MWTEILRILVESALLVVLVKYLAVPAIMERLKTSLSRELESFRQELGLAKVTYDQHLTLLLDYYNRIYKHYRQCQEAASWDIVVHPATGERDPKDNYLDVIDKFKGQWDTDEGKIRLLLPTRLLDCHQAVISAINDFTRACKDYSPDDDDSKEAVKKAFHPVDKAIQSLEVGLRDYLRTEKLLA